MEVMQAGGEVNLGSFIMDDMTGPPMVTGAYTTHEKQRTSPNRKYSKASADKSTKKGVRQNCVTRVEAVSDD